VREERLRRRGDTSDADIERRLELGDRHDAEAADLFDHVIVNDELSVAIDEVADILSAIPEHPLDAS
jgi:guanylate kinase